MKACPGNDLQTLFCCRPSLMAEFSSPPGFPGADDWLCWPLESYLTGGEHRARPWLPALRNLIITSSGDRGGGEGGQLVR